MAGLASSVYRDLIHPKMNFPEVHEAKILVNFFFFLLVKILYHFIPEIFIESRSFCDDFEQKPIEVSVNAKSMGRISLQECNEFIDRIKKAQNVMAFLENFNIFDLYVLDVEN